LGGTNLTTVLSGEWTKVMLMAKRYEEKESSHTDGRARKISVTSVVGG
jgi:hypothetical protein